MLFRKWGCLVGPENRIFRKLISVDRKKNGFDYGNHFTLSFSLQSISGKRERKRERVRERKKTELQSSSTIAGEPRAPVRADLASSSPTTAIRNRDLTKHRADCDRCDASRDRDRRFARSCRRSQSRNVDRDLAFMRSRRRSRSMTRSLDRSSRSTAPSNPVEHRSLMIFFLGFVRVFLGLSFPSSFPNTRKYFSENFLKCNQTHENIYASLMSLITLNSWKYHSLTFRMKVLAFLQ